MTKVEHVTPEWGSECACFSNWVAFLPSPPINRRGREGKSDWMNSFVNVFFFFFLASRLEQWRRQRVPADLAVPQHARRARPLIGRSEHGSPRRFILQRHRFLPAHSPSQWKGKRSFYRPTHSSVFSAEKPLKRQGSALVIPKHSSIMTTTKTSLFALAAFRFTCAWRNVPLPGTASSVLASRHAIRRLSAESCPNTLALVRLPIDSNSFSLLFFFFVPYNVLFFFSWKKKQIWRAVPASGVRPCLNATSTSASSSRSTSRPVAMWCSTSTDRIRASFWRASMHARHFGSWLTFTATRQPSNLLVRI